LIIFTLRGAPEVDGGDLFVRSLLLFPSFRRQWVTCCMRSDTKKRSVRSGAPPPGENGGNGGNGMRNFSRKVVIAPARLVAAPALLPLRRRGRGIGNPLFRP
jgi:hypothetical protein